ncbi:MAG: Hsp20/alpha crystallin family protein [Ardenticatenaceae bacterium]
MFFTRLQPKQNVTRFRHPVDRLFDEPFFQGPIFRVHPHFKHNTVPIDLIEKDEEFVVRAQVPGFDPEQIDITVQDDVLTLRSEVKEEKETKEDTYHRREHRSGSFERKVRLPSNVDSDNATAESKNGILTIHLPKAQANGAHKINIK